MQLFGTVITLLSRNAEDEGVEEKGRRREGEDLKILQEGKILQKKGDR